MKNNVKTCRDCVFLGRSQTGAYGCIRTNASVELDESYCSWRIDIKDDPKCDICGQPTFGKSVHDNRKVYCQNCCHKII